VGEGLVNSSLVVTCLDVGWTFGGVAHSFCVAVRWLSEPEKCCLVTPMSTAQLLMVKQKRGEKWGWSGSIHHANDASGRFSRYWISSSFSWLSLSASLLVHIPDALDNSSCLNLCSWPCP